MDKHFNLKFRSYTYRMPLFYFGMSILLSTTSCSSGIASKPYGDKPPEISRRVDDFCEGLAVTHFVVQNRLVIVKKKNSPETFNLRHIRTSLPDGYYFCSKQEKVSDME